MDEVGVDTIEPLAKIEVQKKNKELANAAEKKIFSPIPLITDKDIISPSGDERDYVSLSPYWFKAEDGRLEERDGEINPEVKRYSDPQKLNEVANNIFITSSAAVSSKDKEDRKKYADYAISALKTWFVNDKTRMTPSLEYAQMKIGEKTGNHYGIVEGVDLIHVVKSVTQLKEGGLINEEAQKGVENWFNQYLRWLRESDKGKRQKDMSNNHGTFYDVQVAYIADFLGKDEIAKEAIESTKQRIKTQITPEGEMPHETKRAIPYDYQLFNLYGMSEMAGIAKKYDVDLWNYKTRDGRCLKKAFEYFTNELLKTKSNPFKKNRSGELYSAFRAASKAYRVQPYWKLPETFYKNPLVDEVTSEMFKN